MLKFALFLIFATLLKNCCNAAALDNKSVPTKVYPRNCYEALITPTESNIHLIQVDTFGPNPFLVVCEPKHGGGWTVIQRRQNGAIDFYRNWKEYKTGFGDWTNEFWLGLDKIHAITNDALYEMLIVMEAFSGQVVTARYSLFAIGDESEGYALKLLGNFSGTAGDALGSLKSRPFATFDRDRKSCAVNRRGAWWYDSCSWSNLNGLYNAKNTITVTNNRWDTFLMDAPLKFTQMMIRPKI